MSNLVIVAIPAKDDAVWKVSTEKVPHLTLLFLGEMQDDDGDLAEDTQRIVDFVGHAVDVAEHGQFMMDVDYRDNLGPDDADVLFFKKNGWSSKWITQFRSQLLQQTDIKTAYDSAPQYEEWTPHLTLGYPTAPAKDDAIEYPISWISFDRIAVWTGDYEGPEFRLQWPERDSDLSVAYGETMDLGAEFIEHFGVKGMRWGVRKDQTITVGGKTKQVSSRQAKRADRKWEQKAASTRKYIEFHNKVADEANKRLPKFNEDPRWKGKDLTKDPKLEKQYLNEFHDMMYRIRHQAVKDVYGMNSPTAKKMIVPIEGSDKLMIVGVEHEAQHAADDVVYNLTKDAKGFVISIAPDTLAQTTEIGEQFVLEHYGVLGMKWGRRKEESSGPPAPVAPHATSRVPQGNKRKTQIETSGGENHPAHEDAIKVAKAQAKLKKSGLAALSNRELQDVATRVQLEKQVSLLTGHKGKQFVQKHLRTSGDELTRQTIRTGIKRAGIAAVLA